MIFDTTTRSLEVVLAGAVTTNELPIVVGFIVGILPQSLLRKAQTSVSNGTTAVTVLSAPSTKESRTVTFVSVRNADTVSATVTVRYNDNTTIRDIITVVLAVDDTLLFTEEEGFKVIDSTGSLKSTGGAAGGGDDIGARAFNSANISVANSTQVALTFNSERWDTDTIHNNSTNTERLTATTAGKYIITGHVLWATNSTGVRQLSVRLNGSTFIGSQRIATLASADVIMSVATLYDLSATDYVELMAFQDSGGSLNVNVSAQVSPEFAMQKILG